MRVYEETNFLVELALDQEQSPAARELIAAGRGRECELSLPVFSVAEAIAAVHQKHARRNQSKTELEHQQSMLKRSSRHRQLVDNLTDVIFGLDSATAIEAVALQDVSSEFSRAGKVLEADGEMLTGAVELNRITSLSLQDALGLSAILTDLRGRPPASPSIFVSRDVKAFGQDAVDLLLAPHQCRHIGSYAAAVNMVRSGTTT